MSDERVDSTLEELFDALERQTDGRSHVRVADLFDAFPERVFGPVLLLPALLALSPLGVIPLVPSLVGLVLILVAGQRLIGIRRPWIPRSLQARGIERQRVKQAIARVRPWARRVDRLLRPRLTFLLVGPMANVAAGVVVFLAATMPPLELVPFAVFLPALAVTLLALAITAADGLLALLGIAFAVTTIIVLARGFGWL